ncbi:MAG: hypothetical protein JO063_06680 [Pseudonocardiales bacterium]|nr:hypothetical protein [Pseudonocardiales bacterium]MBV9030631.1 hypothetical protein [Pseudonocardiales bacterium]MBW0009788.1 hypothetical protein [Pseudonocardiales bacterium]
MPGSVERADAQLTGVVQRETSLRAAVDAGELWLEAGVAERAAARCDQAVRDIDELLRGADVLTKKRKFGDNEDGNAAAERFAQAGYEYIDSMRHAQRVFANMAATYRAAGRTVAEADAANEEMFRGRSE